MSELPSPSHCVRSSWWIPEHQATPEWAFMRRREFLSAMGIAGVGLAGSALLGPAAHAQDRPSAALKTADLYPAKRNEAFVLDRALTPEEDNSTYNNFYEYGSHKKISQAAEAGLVTDPWSITIDGLVEKPEMISFEELARAMPLEERLYRHRCVEAWSMTIPWTGFPVAALLARVAPKPEAAYVRFETFLDPEMASGQKQSWYPWPYVEGITIDEAKHDLAFLVTGAYGKPVHAAHGAPLRLALPWKYGFKSIKSITRISFVAERPVSFWEKVGPDEYGFWANVNPEVPHPRWSQAMEQVLPTGDQVPTLLYNGYGEQVASLYAGKEGEKLFM